MKREQEMKILQYQAADKHQWSIKWQDSLVKMQLLVCHRIYFISSLILDAVPQQFMSGYEPQGHIYQVKDHMRLQLIWNSGESQYHNTYGASLSV